MVRDRRRADTRSGRSLDSRQIVQGSVYLSIRLSNDKSTERRRTTLSRVRRAADRSIHPHLIHPTHHLTYPYPLTYSAPATHPSISLLDFPTGDSLDDAQVVVPREQPRPVREVGCSARAATPMGLRGAASKAKTTLGRSGCNGAVRRTVAGHGGGGAVRLAFAGRGSGGAVRRTIAGRGGGGAVRHCSRTR